jgi:hypothetical protein
MPEAYGYTEAELKEIHEKHGESRGTEGKAREEIMESLLKRGWIRIRHVPRNDLWSIQCFNLGSRQKDYLFRWANDLTENEWKKYADVRLDTGKTVEQTSVKGLMSSEILCSAKNKRREQITYITDSYEFLEIPYKE